MRLILDALEKVLEYARDRGMGNEEGVIMHALDKLKTIQHIDLAAVQEHRDEKEANKEAFQPPKTREEAIERMREDGDADPEGTAAMNYPELFSDQPGEHELDPLHEIDNVPVENIPPQDDPSHADEQVDTARDKPSDRP